MLFNSVEFIFIFLPVVILIYQILKFYKLNKYSIIFLLISSLSFYAYWRIDYIVLLTSSITFNYIVYIFANNRKYIQYRKLLIFSGIAFNLLLIAYYKYIGFLLADVFRLDLVELEFQIPLLPLAISFFTFQQISFLVDSYKDKEMPRVYFYEYAAYVAFFPQLIAGPIVRHNELIPQFHSEKAHKPAFVSGLFLFSIGLAKKVIIADGVSVWANIGFQNPGALSFTDAWIASLSYTFQLYFDFSGYSDMAVGLALMFGFRIPYNFNSPYKAISIQDFWRRWHMTLSRWLRDYLYIPLGGNRLGAIRTYINLAITMLLGGLWHGAGWTFVIWGGLHGLALSIDRLISRYKWPLPVFVTWSVTFLFIVCTWVVFRATNISDAGAMLAIMFGMEGLALPGSWANGLGSLFDAFGIAGVEVPQAATRLPQHAWIVLVILLVVATKLPNSQELLYKLERAKARHAWIMLAMAGMAGTYAVKRLMESNAASEFLYFQF